MSERQLPGMCDSLDSTVFSVVAAVVVAGRSSEWNWSVQSIVALDWGNAAEGEAVPTWPVDSSWLVVVATGHKTAVAAVLSESGGFRPATGSAPHRARCCSAEPVRIENFHCAVEAPSAAEDGLEQPWNMAACLATSR